MSRPDPIHAKAIHVVTQYRQKVRQRGRRDEIEVAEMICAAVLGYTPPPLPEEKKK